MRKLDEIKKPIAEEFSAFEKEFKGLLKSPVPLLNVVLRYLVRQKGKQMRPLFVFLSAEVCGGITRRSYHAASLIELMHTATLVHDDVVDDSYERRGFFSINALWKNKIAVLTGDFLLSRGLLLALDHKDFDLLQIVSQATREMSEGELLQIERARKLDIDESLYFDIIRKKTASLIASCCAAGAASAGANDDLIEKMRLLGEKVGIAFQIKDDLFDYEKTNKTGKPTGADLKEKKLTLPMIYFLERTEAKTKKKTIRKIRRHNENPKKVNEIISLVNESGGIEYARQKMDQLKQEAIEIIHEFPASEARDSLEKLVIFTTQRKY
ncbi:MAG: polyprenyl synthetase family protein [Bacteroidales bacterium]|nr:polyprenyl synthetase family protein [Bacteroidales bacterium]MCF8327720.1 polyprenyl synthetase family protein [Bacteroidales bacterium]